MTKAGRPKPTITLAPFDGAESSGELGVRVAVKG